MSESHDDVAAEVRTEEKLRVLTRRLPVAPGWAPGDVVRRTGRRRRARWATAAGSVVLLAAGLAVALTGGSGGTRPPTPLAVAPGVHTGARIGSAVQLVANTTPVGAADPEAESAVAAADQRLTLALLKQVDGGSGNVSVSPSSLYLALAMLQNGARGETLDQISSALQADGISTDKQNAGLATLTHDWASAAKAAGISIESANSIWQQRGFPVRAQFLAQLARYYRTGVWQVDFADHMADALAAMNTWTSQHTHGKITKLFDKLDSDTVMVLANAIYFHAAWATPFDPGETGPGRFTTDAGSKVTARFMSGEMTFSAVQAPDYSAAQLPYRGGRFAALAVMPTSGKLADFVRGLTPGRLAGIANSLAGQDLVQLPKFTTTSTIDLMPVLSALGINVNSSDFSGLSKIRTRLESAIQRVYLRVAEKGTTAAAVTGIGSQVMSRLVGPTIRFDHPFLFLVRDTKTGAIMFASAINNPATA